MSSSHGGKKMWCVGELDEKDRSERRVLFRSEEVIKRKLVPRVGRETIRVLLESHELKPWREKNVVRGRVGREVHRQHGRRAQDIRKASRLNSSHLGIS